MAVTSCEGSLAFPFIASYLLGTKRRLLATSPYDLHRTSTCWTIRPEAPSETLAVSIRSRPTRGRFQPHVRLELHSWGSSKIPIHRHHHRSPLPNEPSPVLRCAACQAVHSFRPCRSTRLRRFPPPVASQVCCTLQPIIGFAVFQSTRVRHKFARDGRGISPTAHALRSFSLASSSDASPRPMPSRRRSRETSRHHLAMVRPSTRSLDLRALLHLRSRCERSTVASRVLPVASLGFSFQSVSCPTRRSSELRAHNRRSSRQLGDFSFTLGEPRASSHRRRWC